LGHVAFNGVLIGELALSFLRAARPWVSHEAVLGQRSEWRRLALGLGDGKPAASIMDVLPLDAGRRCRWGGDRIIPDRLSVCCCEASNIPILVAKPSTYRCSALQSPALVLETLRFRSITVAANGDRT
jgi:hypothetical protein